MKIFGYPLLNTPLRAGDMRDDNYRVQRKEIKKKKEDREYLGLITNEFSAGLSRPS